MCTHQKCQFILFYRIQFIKGVFKKMIVLDNDSRVPLYLQIYEQLKEEIISGEILEGSKLYSTRTLATTLNVSRNTVESAYLQLSSEGYVTSKAGSGFIVEKLDSMLITS